MPLGRSLTLTDGSILGLFFMQRYRFLTIGQFARVAGLKKSTASSQLLMLERYGLLGHFGNTGLVGHGKTPKVYFLTRKGHEILLRESDIPPELIGHHKKIHVQSRWSPQMYHRLQTVDVMISAECAVRRRPHLRYAVRNPGHAGSVIAEKFYAMALCRTRSGSQGTALASGIFAALPYGSGERRDSPRRRRRAWSRF